VARRPSAERLDALTGLRFFAAIHVVLFHFTDVASGGERWIRNALVVGGSEVGLFFVLSGFVLAYAARSPIDSREFWIRRFARIYPAFFLAAVVGGALTAEVWLRRDGAAEGLLRVAAASLVVFPMLQGWLPQTGPWFNFPAWSLSAEAFFYAIFPFSYRRLKERSNAWLLKAIVVLLAVALVAPALATLFDLGSTWQAAIGRNPILRSTDFLVGCALGELFRRGYRVSLLSSTMVLVLYAGALELSRHLPVIFWSNGGLLPAQALVVFVVAQGAGGAARLLSTKPLVLLGEASYGIYIFQDPVRRLLEKVVTSTQGRAFVLLDVLVLVAVSIVVMVYFERPARRQISSRLLARRAVVS
jgi:peptidoglycan/LPS O-acetylase OafA/YrhL